MIPPTWCSRIVWERFALLLRRKPDGFRSGVIFPAVILACFYFAMLLALREKSPAVDELGHATAGYSYWKFNDYRIDPENGNLTKRWIALPYLLGNFSFPSLESEAWTRSDSWLLADAWFYRSGNDEATMLLWGRMASGVLGVGLGALVWAWSRRLFGPIGGLVSLLLYVLSPAVLANGALMTSDTAAALMLLASVGAWARFLANPTMGRLTVSAATLGVLFLAKMSAFVALPVMLLLGGLRLRAGGALSFGGICTFRSRLGQAAFLLAALVLHAVVVAAMIWTSFGFRYSAVGAAGATTARLYLPWQFVLGQEDPIAMLQRLDLNREQDAATVQILYRHGALQRIWQQGTLDAFDEIDQTVLRPEQSRILDELRITVGPALLPQLLQWCRRYQVLPEAYLFGCAHVWRFSDYRYGFLNGEVSPGGRWEFFPFLFLIKTPIAVLAMAVLATVALVRFGCGFGGRRAATDRGSWSRLAPLLALSACYGLAAIASGTNIGHRHILPLYPPLFILCGGVATWFSQEGRTAVVARLGAVLLLLIAAIETTCWFPDYLGYFNGTISPSRAYRHVLDSSLDWGQELPAIRRYVQGLPKGENVYLAYFGIGSPRHYGVKAKHVYAYPGAEREIWKPFLTLPGAAFRRDDPKVAAVLRDDPDYDPATLGSIEVGSDTAVFIAKHGEALQLRGGTYLISATLTQPLYFRHAQSRWSPAHETTYQRLKQELQPILSADFSAFVRAIQSKPIWHWQRTMAEFEEYRFARLAAYLRGRTPHEQIKHSVLVYRLTNEEIDHALNGQPVFR